MYKLLALVHKFSLQFSILPYHLACIDHLCHFCQRLFQRRRLAAHVVRTHLQILGPNVSIIPRSWIVRSATDPGVQQQMNLKIITQYDEEKILANYVSSLINYIEHQG